MSRYYVKWYDDIAVLIRLDAGAKELKAYRYVNGIWKESPNHVYRVLHTPDYDEISEIEAKAIFGA